MATTLPDTAIAAANNGADINVYFQQTDGSIVEHTWRQQKGAWHTSKKNPVSAGVARTFTPLAASIVTADEDDDSTEWHVFYLDTANLLSEVYYSGGKWNTGKLNNLKLEAANFSRLAISSDTLYFQAKGGQIQFVTRKADGSWNQGTTTMTKTAPLLGTSLAAIKGIVIDQGNSCAVESNDGNAVAATAVASASPHTSLAALSDGDYKAIFYTTNASKLKQQYSKPSTGDSFSAEVSNITPRSDIAAVRDKPSDNDPDVLHVFLQKDSGDKIWECKYTAAEGWKSIGAI